MRLLALVILAGCGRIDFDPLADAAPPVLLDISVRGTHGCLVDTAGQVTCWGNNARGQLGRGTLSMREPQGRALIEGIVGVATAESSSFAIDLDGQLWAWGNNESGELGLGMVSAAEPIPRQVTGITSRVTKVAAGEFNGCALTETGEVWCWGSNDCGGAGTGTQAPTPSPTRVQGIPAMMQIAVNDLLSCAADAAGNVLCWGAPDTNGTVCLAGDLAPTPPLGLPPVKELAGGCHLSMCAVDRTGDPWCWGQNAGGNLGVGDLTPHHDPTRVMNLAGQEGIGTGVQISCAYAPGQVACWGVNDRGGLGVGANVAASLIPIPLSPFSQAAISDLEVGCGTVCARSGADVYCWGENRAGQVGNDSTVDQYTPVLIDITPR